MGFIFRFSRLSWCSENCLFLPQDLHEWTTHQYVTSLFHAVCFLGNPFISGRAAPQTLISSWVIASFLLINQSVNWTHVQSVIKVICDCSGQQRLTDINLLCLACCCLWVDFWSRGSLMIRLCADAAVAHMICRKRLNHTFILLWNKWNCGTNWWIMPWEFLCIIIQDDKDR